MYASKDIISSAQYKYVVAVSNRHLCSRTLSEQIAHICNHHPKAVILREKDLTEKEYQILASEILEICNTYHVPCILHTYLETAKKLECSSIHLPLHLLKTYKRTMPETLKSFSVIGTSIHSVEEAIEAQKLGATYLTAGHIYATDCKKGLPPRGTKFLRQVCQNVSIPVYAIGGIKLDQKQLSEVIECGAKGACIMSGMMTL